ncbi:MAG TPA: hypothetical protein VKI19_00615 [Acidimicrobiales bacterium]|nr:hypothetical protein [Acidimicrobiales bacterium]
MAFFDTPATAKTFSMAQFLSFAASQGIQLAALTWHDNTGGPQALAAQAGRARHELAGLPQLGRPKLFINEYGSAAQQRIPGWDVAYLAALNAAAVDGANRSCWSADCQQPTLDGLLTSDGSQARPGYWVRLAYAHMAGTRVAVSSSSLAVTAIATYDPATGAITAIVGRAVGCRQDPRCPSGPRNAAPVPVTVLVQVPWTSGGARIQMSRISSRSVAPVVQPGVYSFSVPITRVTAGRGEIRLPIAGFGDGDAEVLQASQLSH